MNFVKNQDKDGYIYLVGYSGGAGDPRTQSVWRIAAAVNPGASADAGEFVLGGIACAPRRLFRQARQLG